MPTSRPSLQQRRKPLRGPPVNPSPGAGSAFTTAPTPAGSVRSHHQFQLSKPDGGLGHLPVTGRVRGCSGSSGSRPSPDPRRLAPPESSSTENRPSACRIRCKRGHSAPPRPSGTAAWPAAGRSASEPAAQPPPEGLPTPRRYSRVPRKSEPCSSTPFPAPAGTRAIRYAPPEPRTTPALRRRSGTHRRTTASLTPIRPPSMQLPQPGWCARHRKQATLEDSGQQAVTALNPL